jgi:hypothetical protein
MLMYQKEEESTLIKKSCLGIRHTTVSGKAEKNIKD